jgi:hypothetical protein
MTHDSINPPEIKQHTCGHPECNLRFKTHKQKIMHHNKLEPECKLQKAALIKLVANYKKIFLSLVKDYNSDSYDTEKFLKLKRSYEKAEKSTIDKGYFENIVGDSFSNLTK